MLVFSEGILTAIKGAAKAGKLSEILAKFPKVAELAQKAKTLGGDKVERLRRRINEVLDDLGHNPNDELATANGAPLPPNRIEGQTPQPNQPSRMEGRSNGGGNFVPSSAFNELAESIRIAIRNWNLPDSQMQKISDILQNAIDVGDNELSRILAEIIQLSPQEAQTKVMQLVEALWQRQKSIPPRFSIGSTPFREGGQNAVFEMLENRNLLVKKPIEGASNFKNEYRALLRMEMMGIQTALVKMAKLNGETVLILEKISGAISKDIMDISKRRNYVHLVNERTIQDLERIYGTLQRNEVNINDFQFMVREDGRVIMVDPKSLQTNTPPKKEIAAIIEQFKEFANQR